MSCKDTCIPFLLRLPPTSGPIPPSQPSRSTELSPVGIQRLPASCLLYTERCMYVSAHLSVCPPSPVPPWVHLSFLSVCVSIPARASILLKRRWNSMVLVNHNLAFCLLFSETEALMIPGLHLQVPRGPELSRWYLLQCVAILTTDPSG